MIKKMDKGYTHGNQEINIKEHFKMIIDMDMEKCIGIMGRVLKDNGLMEYKLIKHLN
jgi:hypothetical protein